METNSVDESRKGIFIQELYRRIESYVDEVEKARNQLTRFSGLLHSCIGLWESETGQELPEELLNRAGIARAVRVAVPTVALENLSVPEAVFEMMKRIDGALHLNAIVERLFSKGYSLNVKDPKTRVRTALIRGMKRDLYERVGPNTFRINPAVRNKRYQEVY